MLSKNKKDEAKRIVKDIARVNGVPLSEDMLETLSADNTIEMDRKYTFVDLLRPMAMCLLSINIFFNW